MAYDKTDDPLRVFTYYNLHKKVWSIRALSGEFKGLVIGHADSVLLSDVTPKISEAGRQRVLREKAKNVHAGLTGILVAVCSETRMKSDSINILSDLEFRLLARRDINASKENQISYNPYKHSGFFFVSPLYQPFTGSQDAWLSSDRRVYVNNSQ